MAFGYVAVHGAVNVDLIAHCLNCCFCAIFITALLYYDYDYETETGFIIRAMIN